MFLDHFKRLAAHSIYRDSFFILCSTVIGGFLNYIFNPIMARLLGPAQYGELISVLAIMMVITIPVGALSLAVVKYVSLFASQGEAEKIGYFIYLVLRKILVFSFLLLFVYLALLPLLKNFLNLSNYYSLLAAGVLFVISFFGGIIRSVLQGLKKFKIISLITIGESIAKLIFGIGAIYIGFKVGGVIISMGVGSLIICFIIFRIIHISKKSVAFKIDLKDAIIKYTILGFWANLMMILFLNLDILIVKHYFSPDAAGHFGAISLLGKAIFFLGGSLTYVLFPLVSEGHAKNSDILPLLKKTLIVMALGALATTLIYYFGSSIIIKIFFGQEYLSLAPLLWLSGVVFSLYSLISIFVTYYLAIGEKRFLYPLLIGLVILVTVIYFQHSSLNAILYSFVLTFVLIFVTLIFDMILKKRHILFKKRW